MYRASIVVTLWLAACGGKPAAKGNTCKDVEVAMRRLEPERTKDLRAGGFESVCRDKVYDQARIDCVVAAKVTSDLAYCADPGKPRPTPAGTSDALVTKTLPGLKVKLTAPDRASIEERARDAHVGDGAFKLNLFAVDEYSTKDAAAQAASLRKEPGFVAFTREDAAGATWRYEYTLDGGKAGVSLRLELGGRSLDCGVHGTACTTVTGL